MTTFQTLPQLLDASAQAAPHQPAVVESGHAPISYATLTQLSDRVRNRLCHMGVRRGDRVGIYLRKSIDTVAVIFGILKAGAAYVPVDAGAPPARNAYILADCAVKVVVIDAGYVDGLSAELEEHNATPQLFPLPGTGGGLALDAALEEAQNTDPAPTAQPQSGSTDDLAYILYTSGSTGKPKGVMLTHEAALSFIEWCSATFAPTPEDRFSSHAPFHFDLSILDIYLPIKHGAKLVLISEETGKQPLDLANLIAEERISIWYSTPSILTLLMQYGKLAQHDLSALRMVFFAGEVFPIKHLRALKELLPEPRYFNLYGPTETNVCTYYEVPQTIPAERTTPFPIGKVCSHLCGKVVDAQGETVAAGDEGELCISGPGVMQGYWNLPERTASAFLSDESSADESSADESSTAGHRWYKTGDIVIEETSGDYCFVGRRDRMVKKRGYRVELGEIESALYRHPAVKEAAVVALTDGDGGVQVKAFLSTQADQRLSLIALKRFCGENLPAYMIPDLFAFEPALPKTSTDKIDYQRLKEIAQRGEGMVQN